MTSTSRRARRALLAGAATLLAVGLVPTAASATDPVVTTPGGTFTVDPDGGITEMVLPGRGAQSGDLGFGYQDLRMTWTSVDGPAGDVVFPTAATVTTVNGAEVFAWTGGTLNYVSGAQTLTYPQITVDLTMSIKGSYAQLWYTMSDSTVTENDASTYDLMNVTFSVDLHMRQSGTYEQIAGVGNQGAMIVGDEGHGLPVLGVFVNSEQGTTDWHRTGGDVGIDVTTLAQTPDYYLRLNILMADYAPCGTGYATAKQAVTNGLGWNAFGNVLTGAGYNSCYVPSATTLEAEVGVGVDHSVTLTPAQGIDAAWWADYLDGVVAGDVAVAGLPAGVQVSEATMGTDGTVTVRLTGTPEESGAFQLTVTVTPGAGAGTPTRTGLTSALELSVAAAEDASGGGAGGANGNDDDDGSAGGDPGDDGEPTDDGGETPEDGPQAATGSAAALATTGPDALAPAVVLAVGSVLIGAGMLVSRRRGV